MRFSVFYTLLVLGALSFWLFILLNSTCFFYSLVQVLVTFISRDRIPVCTAPKHSTISPQTTKVSNAIP